MSAGLAIYLDDCADGDVLAASLRQAGHTVQNPRGAGLRGATDDRHLGFAARHGYVLLTFNAEHFRHLHEEWQAEERVHAGIFLVYLDNDVARDLGPRGVVRAIRNLISSGIPVANGCHVLNHWR